MSLRKRCLGLIVVATAVLWAGGASALIINPPQAITHEVTIHVVQVFDDAGNNPAPLLGTALQQAAIEGFLDQIWAQAGIDITLEASVTSWDDSFALEGIPGSNDPRPAGDFNTLMADAATDGVLSPDPLTLNMFFVDIVPNSSQNSDNTVNGRAYIGANGMVVWVGPNLPTFGLGQEVVASVLGHEIGHNLGLSHITEAFNLMQAGGAPDQGEILNAAQIATALASPFSVALLPEPSVLVLLGAAGLAAARRRAA